MGRLETILQMGKNETQREEGRDSFIVDSEPGSEAKSLTPTFRDLSVMPLKVNLMLT